MLCAGEPAGIDPSLASSSSYVNGSEASKWLKRAENVQLAVLQWRRANSYSKQELMYIQEWAGGYNKNNQENEGDPSEKEKKRLGIRSPHVDLIGVARTPGARKQTAAKGRATSRSNAN